jgi:hypothetical protein
MIDFPDGEVLAVMHTLSIFSRFSASFNCRMINRAG